MPPKFKLGDNVLHRSQTGDPAMYGTISGVIPFTLNVGDVVNVQEPGIGKCRVRRRHKGRVLLEPLKGYMSNSDYWRNVTQVDQPPGRPVPSYELDGHPAWALENTLERVDTTPKFNTRDTVIFDNSPQDHPFSHGPLGIAGSLHVIADVLPFTLHTAEIVNVKGLGSCTVTEVVGRTAELKRISDGKRNFIPVTDVDQPPGKPVPSYELKGQVDGELGDTFWAPENTLTLVEAHDPYKKSWD